MVLVFGVVAYAIPDREQVFLRKVDVLLSGATFVSGELLRSR